MEVCDVTGSEEEALTERIYLDECLFEDVDSVGEREVPRSLAVRIESAGWRWGSWSRVTGWVLGGALIALGGLVVFVHHRSAERQGGFNRSSQRFAFGGIVDARRAPRLVCASRVSCVVCC
jgi:hypothetical protein